MQFAKEEIRQRIMEAARAEFMGKGFRDASIRSITAKARTSKSNLYNYFADKDALFRAVLDPVLTDIEKGLAAAMAFNAGKPSPGYSYDTQKEYIRIVMEYVYAHVDDIKLLLFQAGGSSLENYKDKVIEGFAGVLADWMKRSAPRQVSRFFLRCVAGFYLNAIEGMLAGGVAPAQAAGHFDEFMAFVYGGWSAVLQINNEERS
jgi:AcrR family transcriptional regulator